MTINNDSWFARGSTSTYGSNQPGDHRDPRRILVVDDERAIVHFLHDLLESEGYHVHDAFDGSEAINIMREHPPHLVISDIMMPRASGYDVAHVIDRLSDRIAPKVILMSGNSQRVSNTEIPFIEKPFDVDDLLELIDTTLDGSPNR